MERQVCLICSTPINSIHLGVEACRACSSFFTRATRLGRNYPCRRGARNCAVNRERLDAQKPPPKNGACRRCRYDKCVAVGMVYDGLLRPRRKDENPPESLLDRIGRELEMNVAIRQAKELALLRKRQDAVRLPHPVYEIYECTTDVVVMSIQFVIQETWTLFHKIFPALGEVPYQEQAELFRFYLPKFTMIDSFLRTWKVWGVLDKFSMCSVTNCIDLTLPDRWIGPGDGGANRSTQVDSTVGYVRDQMAVLVPSMKRAKLTEKEVHALFAMMLSETDMKMDVSEHLLSILDGIRNETLRDLQRYYREEMGLSDYSTRLGNLMTISHNVRECSSQFQSFFRMQVTLFDLWSAETQLKELLL